MIRILRSDATVAMAARATQGATLALGAAAVIAHNSPVEQGFWFTFIGFGILLQLCDFGLSYASLQTASHLRARDGAGLGALAYQALRINALVTLACWPVVAFVGWRVFDGASGHASVAWQAPWACFVTMVALNQLTGPYLFLVEGGVSVGAAWRFRLAQELVSGSALVLVLLAGLGLWSLVAYYGGRFAMAAGWMLLAPIRIDRSRAALASRGPWRRDLWPFQWRVGVGAVSGYLVFQAFGPILFALQGPEPAGRFSLSLSVMNAIVMVTTAWPVSQAAHFGVLYGRGDGVGLMRTWRATLVRSTGFALLVVIVVGCAFAVLDRMHPDITRRFAGSLATLVLVACAVVHHVAACISVLLRSQRRDPLLVLNVVGGVVVLAALTLAASIGGIALVALAYGAGVLAMLACAVVLVRRFAAQAAAGLTPASPPTPLRSS